MHFNFSGSPNDTFLQFFCILSTPPIYVKHFSSIRVTKLFLRPPICLYLLGNRKLNFSKIHDKHFSHIRMTKLFSGLQLTTSRDLLIDLDINILDTTISINIYPIPYHLLRSQDSTLALVFWHFSYSTLLIWPPLWILQNRPFSYFYLG